MGRIVKNANVASQRYALSVPEIRAAEPATNGHIDDFDRIDILPEQASIVEKPAGIDWDAVRHEAAEVVSGAERDAEGLIEDARDRAMSLIEDAAGDAQRIEEDAHAAGFDRGVTDGRTQAGAEMDEMLATMRGLVEMARIERHKIIEGAEPEIVKLAYAIAEKVVHQQVAVDRNVVVQMAKAAIARLVHRETITVRVNPADLEAMRDHRERMLALGDIEHLRLIEDQRVDRGGVVVETESGTIDAKVGTQLDEARKVLNVPVLAEESEAAAAS
ncbi:MAG: hypothetical protein JOZ38_11070 [Candidatus Eremiobacteraeota bacterium]|nr:hypothetical protein [Candidatus Eremiobacteraeota bacterium]